MKIRTPNKRIIREWVKALPNYKQGENYLRVGNRFCCLGVLCDLYAKKFKINWEIIPSALIGESCYSFLKQKYSLPIKVADWVGLPIRPTVELDSFRSKLDSINDGGATFKKIAKLIEKEWLSKKTKPKITKPLDKRSNCKQDLTKSKTSKNLAKK